MKKEVCGAKLRGKNATCRKPPMANGRCRLHGGKTPNGPDNPSYKHGLYADAFHGALRDRYERMQKTKNPLDMLPDLYVQRTLLETYLDQIGNGRSIKLSELMNASALAQDAVRSAATITQARQKQAFTIAEWKFLQRSIMLLMEKYVPDPDQRRNFIEDILAIIPATDESEANEPSELSAGTGTASQIA